MGSFDGKIALVTGSTQGVGYAAVRRLAAEGAAGLVVCGRSRDRGEAVADELGAAGVDALFVPVELDSPDSCRALVAAVDERFGRLDALVNAAGTSLRGDILDADVELFDHLIAVNARAPFILMQGAIRIMIREGLEGAIVNVASLASSGSVPRLLPYAASKAAPRRSGPSRSRRSSR
jgi:NAD(P)-dependent dehydrogenase (short-subunit alcohol dehydrogenase family)